MAPHQAELSEAQRARVALLLPPRETKGAFYEDHPRILNGILFRHATGCAWRDLPERYCPWSTAASRLRRSRHDGSRDGILERLQRELDSAGQIDWTLWCIDSSSIRAQQAAGGACHAGAGKNSSSTTVPRRAARPVFDRPLYCWRNVVERRLG